MTTALLIVDVQNDFTEEGALAVAGGTRVAEAITAHLAASAGRYTTVLASRDWHDGDSDNGGHFAAEPDYLDTWPVHCVAGTAGAEYHPALAVDAVDVHIRKGQGKPSYSAFEGTADDGAPVPALLERLGVTELDVVGLATDYCVRASALDARAAGLEVRVLSDLVAGVSPEASAAALLELAEAGVRVEVSSTVLPSSTALPSSTGAGPSTGATGS
jgi:nicotinamidase/pyrazinamidase